MKRFEDSAAIITGPSDQGIGGAIAERLAEEGADLILLGLEKPTRLIKRLVRRGTSVCWHRVDVTNTQMIQDAVSCCYEELGHIEILVNNAGVEFSKKFEEIADDEWDRLISVNLTGAMKMTRAVLPFLTEQGGVIINIASVLGMAGCPGFHAYSASKAGLIGMTQSLALEIAPYGQRALCVSPAIVQTPMAHKHSADLNSEAWQKLEDAHPLGIGRPQDVADVVAFLASHEARWMTGISIPLGWIPSFGLPAPSASSMHHSAELRKNQVISTK
ncbi:SDR family oxidoreductase [Rubinisphaera sp.]|uniref:SDR family NAD(P)-dependent oxidoreductase n=1 Tax=Rubinisphaera sp. TaxID=2024857 RepID=UPI000C10279E|nr:SDR family oxidoreductase [Rubinisphaera sp.]MBV07855.1 hypothetical protein [Rubinisphaera sp.]|tara:strand:+ start:2733 stop:3554 length:822 start_codon:yes stop_codon:yes gene_type:complete